MSSRNIAAASGLLMVAALVGAVALISTKATACDPPRYLLDSDIQGIQPAVDEFARGAFDEWNVQHPSAARVAAQFYGQTLRNYQEGKPLDAGRLRFTVRLMDEAWETIFGVFPSKKGYRDYWIVVERDCAGSDWRVTSAVLQHDRSAKALKSERVRREGSAGGKQASVNVP